MKQTTSLLTMSLVALALASPARAERGVKDNGNFFSPEVEQKANQTIEHIYKDHRSQDVLIETYSEVPGGAQPRDFARQRAQQAARNGLYVIIVRKGGVVGVLPDRDLQSLFTDSVQTELRQRLESDLRAAKNGPFDQALLNAVQFIDNTFERGERVPAGGGGGTGAAAGGAAGGGAAAGGGSPSQQRTSPTPAPRRTGGLFSGMWGWICLIIGGLLIFNIIRGIMRSRTGGGPGGYGQPGYGQPGYGQPGYGYGGGPMGGRGGGGFGSSILGGLFGAAAGSWMYDRFFRSGTAHGAPPTDPGGASGGMGAGGADFGGGGAPTQDWGAGGGDFSSGGSFSDGGGGDFGGGGGDFGGGE